ncbi:MAG: hypothetical protein U0R80_09220 [Nocardioidaceae bacterium]
MKTLAISLLTAAALLAAPATALGQSALAPARSTVTITAEGTDLSGTLSSPRAACVENRKVLVIKQIGARGGGDDQSFASDTADADGSWNTGNTGTAGKFYAKVKKTARCKADTSPTIRATR